MRLHEKPRFSSASRGFQQSTNSAIYHLQHPMQKKQKMSQSFSNNINSLNTDVRSRKRQKISQSFSNNTNSLNTTVTNNFTVGDDRSEILAWLSPLDPKLRHQDIQSRRVENVGEWLLQTEEFRGWYASSEGGECDNAVLFCYGDPGVGKTFIR